ncbi:proteoglycan 4 isoform X2 [Esox lucius]|uniref:proteoglycan 4 isoform X2 n=1 Tax=Esox lucius TaxID=8010 RepID=UPI0009733C99|nr:proteoglycan 4 isoform X2 [Esox lucius]
MNTVARKTAKKSLRKPLLFPRSQVDDRDDVSACSMSGLVQCRASPPPSHVGDGSFMDLPQTTAPPPHSLSSKNPLSQPTLSAKTKICMPVQNTWKGEPYDKPLLKYTTALPIGRRHCRSHPIQPLIPNSSPNLTNKRVKFKNPEATLHLIPAWPDLEQFTQQTPTSGGQLVRPLTRRPPSRKQPQSADQRHLDAICSHSSLTTGEAVGGENSGGGGDRGFLSRSVRDLLLLTSSSDDDTDFESPSEPLFRCPTPAYLTRRYQNSLKWYQAVRSEKKIERHNKMLQQLCDEGTSDRPTAEKDPSGVQARHSALQGAGEGSTICKQGGKRKRSLLLGKRDLPPSRVRRWDRRSWRRELDSSSSDSPASDSIIVLSSAFFPPAATSTPPDSSPLSMTPCNTLLLSHSLSLSTPSSCPSTPLYPHSFTSSAPGTPLQSDLTSPVRTKSFYSSAPCTPQHAILCRDRSNISGNRTTCCGLERCPTAAKETNPPLGIFNINVDTVKTEDSEMSRSNEMKTSRPNEMGGKGSPIRAKTFAPSDTSPILKKENSPHADRPLRKPMETSAGASALEADHGILIPGRKLTLTPIFSNPCHVPETRKRSPHKSPKSPQATTAHQKPNSPQDTKSSKKIPKTSESLKLTLLSSEKQTDKTQCNFMELPTPQIVVSTAGIAESQHVIPTKNIESQSAGGNRPSNKTSPSSDPLLKGKDSANTASLQKPKEDRGRNERPPFPGFRDFKQAFKSLLEQRPVVAKPPRKSNIALNDIQGQFKTPSPKTCSLKTSSPKTISSKTSSPNTSYPMNSSNKTTSHKTSSPKTSCLWKPQSRGLFRTFQDPKIQIPIQNQSPSIRPTSNNNPEEKPPASTSVLGRSSELKMRQAFQQQDTPRPKSYPPKSKPFEISPGYIGTPFQGSTPISRGLKTSHGCPSRTRSSQSNASYSARARWEREDRERERWQRERSPASPRQRYQAWGPVPQPTWERNPKEGLTRSGKEKTSKRQDDLKMKVQTPLSQKKTTTHKSCPNVPSPCQYPPPARNGSDSRSKNTNGTRLPTAHTKSKVPGERTYSQHIRLPSVPQQFPHQSLHPRSGPSSPEIIHAIVSVIGYLLGVPPTSIPGFCPSLEDPSASSTPDPSAFHLEPSQHPLIEELRLLRQRLSKTGPEVSTQPTPNAHHTKPSYRPQDR